MPILPFLTEVTFDFSLSGDVYRVYRKPEQIRLRKKDGRATTTKSDATLFKRTGLECDSEEGTVLATQWKRVTEEIERLIGFRSDQFRQVIMLPQGEFRRLLLSDSKDRQTILEVLFGTELYRRIEEALKNAAKDIEIRIKDAQKRLKFILEQAEVESEEQLSDQHTEAKSRGEQLGNHVEKLKSNEIQARQRLNEGRAAVESLKELELSEKVLDTYHGQEIAVTAKRKSLTAARRAAVLEPEEKALAVRTREADETSQQLKKCRESMVTTISTRDKAVEKLKHHEQEQLVVKELRMELGKLEALIPRVRELDDIKTKVSVAGKEFFLKDRALEAAKKSLEDNRSQMEKILPQREEAEKVAARLEFLQLKARELEQAYQTHTKLQSLREDESREMAVKQEIGVRLTGAENDLAAALAEYKRIEDQWIEGQAAILAARLEPGAPCPVCGSKDHPTPASLDQEAPNEKMLKAKAAKVDRFRSLGDQIRLDKNSVEIRLSKIRVDSDARKEGLGDFASRGAEEIQIECEDVHKELKRADVARKKAAHLIRQLEHIEKAVSEASQTCSQAEEQRNECLINLQRLQAEFSATKAQVPDDFQEIRALERAIADKSNKCKLMEDALDASRKAAARANELVHASQAALQSAEDNAAICSARVLAQREEFRRNLVQAGFPDEASFKNAQRMPEEIQALETEIESFDRGIERGHRQAKSCESQFRKSFATEYRRARECGKRG